MQLKPDLYLPDFFRAVHTCQGNVSFRTPEGDCLNLKSTLSQFVFAAALAGQINELNGTLHCSAEDELILKPFLQDTP